MEDKTRAEVIEAVEAALQLGPEKTEAVVAAFLTFVANRLAETFSTDLKAVELAKRNPYVYASLGYTNVDEWARRVFEDKLTSSAEGLMGNFLEEVARI